MSSPISSPAKAASQEVTARTPSRTPRRAISAEPYSARASIHTPLDRIGVRDFRASLRRGTPASAGRSNAPTPHAKAARRLLDQRRTAMFTPGKKRRQSMIQQRETPLDVLRNLGRALASKSQPIQYSSSSSSSSSPGIQKGSSPEQQEQSNLYDDDEDDDVDEFLTRRPRISLPMDEDASSMSSEIPPPQLSQLDEDNFTVQSIEMPRRYADNSRLSRGSPGSERISDYFNNEPTDDIGQQSDFFPGFLENLEAGAGQDDVSLASFEDQTRRMTEGRGSDFNLDIPEGLDEQTVFQMSDPADGMQQTSPIVDQSVAEARGDEAHATQQNVVFGSDSDGGAGDFGMDGWDYDDGGMDDHSSINEGPDTALEPTVTTTTHHMPADDRLPRGLKANKKRKRVSQHGIEYPSLPPAFVKRVAQTALQSSGLSNQRLSAETLDALIQSSEWFFEQLGDDLGAYADHAKRKTIEESDVFTLMKRQRQIGPRSSMFSLAQKHLPRELLQELRMPVPQPIKRRKAKRVSDQGDEREVAEYT